MIAMFCGHSVVEDRDKVEKWLFTVVESLIKEGCDEFYLGGYGDFDFLACEVLRLLKKKYPQVKRVLVLAYLGKGFDGKYYDSSYYPELEKTPKRAAIIKRNKIMVDESTVVIGYVLRDLGSGAFKTLQYARNKKKKIIQYEE